MPKTLYDVIKDQINDNIERVSQVVVLGNLESFNEYQRLAGVIQGLTSALNVVKDLEQRQMELEYDDE
jgi:hypothetical protein